MLVLGLDPGITGAYALVSFADETGADPEVLLTHDMPICTFDDADMVDGVELVRQLKAISLIYGPLERIVIEKVQGSPKQGATNAFRFGMSYAAALNAALAITSDVIPAIPRTWKRKLRVPGKGSDADKQRAVRAIASQRFPGAENHWPLQKDHDRAEAALLTLFSFC